MISSNLSGRLWSPSNCPDQREGRGFAGAVLERPVTTPPRSPPLRPDGVCAPRGQGGGGRGLLTKIEAVLGRVESPALLRAVLSHEAAEAAAAGRPGLQKRRGGLLPARAAAALRRPWQPQQPAQSHGRRTHASAFPFCRRSLLRQSRRRRVELEHAQLQPLKSRACPQVSLIKRGGRPGVGQRNETVDAGGSSAGHGDISGFPQQAPQSAPKCRRLGNNGY